MRLRLLLVNQNGDSLNTLLYGHPNSFLRANAAFEDRQLALQGGGFALLAELDTVGATYSVVLKVNRRLQPQWQYTYRAQPLFGFPRSMFLAGACELQDSSVLVLTSNLRGSPNNNPYYLLRLSGTTGQLLNTYQFISTICSQFQANKLLPDGDSAVYVLGTCLGKTYAAHISLHGLPAVVTTVGSPVAPATAHVALDALYPNPADESATLSYRCPPGLTGPGTLRIRDVLGREAYRLAVASSAAGTVRLPTAGLAQGIYVCELSWPSQPPAMRKLLVRH
jgi:hypothetical protein